MRCVMEYTFSTLRSGESVIKIKNGCGKVLSGFQSFTKEYDDCFITDNFEILDLIKSEEGIDGEPYTWYTIKGHERIIDKTAKIAMQNKANIDYIAMMADIDIEV